MPLDNRRDNREASQNLCRNLCRNPSIPTRIGCSRVVSFGNKRGTEDMHQTRMNTAAACYLDFFDVTSSRTESRIRNDEVAGSIPASSTKFSRSFDFLPRTWYGSAHVSVYSWREGHGPRRASKNETVQVKFAHANFLVSVFTSDEN